VCDDDRDVPDLKVNITPVSSSLNAPEAITAKAEKRWEGLIVLDL